MEDLMEGRQSWKLPMEQVEADPRPLDRGIMGSMASPVGMLYPVIVLEKEDGWRVYDGRVRYRCAQELGWERIEAFIAGDELEAERLKYMITLAANARAKNPIGEAKAIAALEDDELAMEVGALSKGELDARKRLDGLVPEVKAMVEDGGMSTTAAKRLTAFNHDQQREIIEKAQALMEANNEVKRRKPRTVPTFAEVDQAVRAFKGKLQPAIPVMSSALKKAGPSGPDPVRLAAMLRKLASGDGYTEAQRAALEAAADVLEFVRA